VKSISPTFLQEQNDVFGLRIVRPTPEKIEDFQQIARLQFGSDRATSEGLLSSGTVTLRLSANPGGAFIQW
jgi:hypothetical protein